MHPHPRFPQHGPSQGWDRQLTTHTCEHSHTPARSHTAPVSCQPRQSRVKNSPPFPFWFSSRQIICKCRNRQKLYPMKEGDVWKVVRVLQGLGWLIFPIQSCCLGSHLWPGHMPLARSSCMLVPTGVHTPHVGLCPAFTGAPSPSCCPQIPSTAQHPTGLCASCRSSQRERTVPPLLPPSCERLCFPRSNFYGLPQSFLLPFPCLCSEEEQAWEQPDPQRARRLPGHCTVTDPCCRAAPVTASPGAEQAQALQPCPTACLVPGTGCTAGLLVQPQLTEPGLEQGLGAPLPWGHHYPGDRLWH